MQALRRLEDNCYLITPFMSTTDACPLIEVARCFLLLGDSDAALRATNAFLRANRALAASRFSGVPTSASLTAQKEHDDRAQRVARAETAALYVAALALEAAGKPAEAARVLDTCVAFRPGHTAYQEARRRVTAKLAGETASIAPDASGDASTGVRSRA